MLSVFSGLVAQVMEKLISNMTCNVSVGMLNLLSHSLHSIAGRQL